MRVLVVTQYFPPENVPIPASIVRGLAERGHSVRVLTGFPSYPAGKLFPGVKQKWRQYEVIDHVHICRVPSYIDHSRNPVRRIASYLTFALSSATAGGWSKGADVVYVYATQMTPALGPWLWRLLGGAPYVLHIQDLWPDSIVGSSMVSSAWSSRVVECLLNPWIRSVYRRAAAVIGIAPRMVSELVDRGVPSIRSHLVYNWTDEEPIVDLGCDGSPCYNHTVILYAGNVGDMQDLESAVEAAHAAREAGIQLLIVGDGVATARLRSLTTLLGCENVKFRRAVPFSEIGRMYKCADYALVGLRDLPAFRGTIPSKLQTALAFGVPVITTVEGDVREIVESSDVGFTAEPENPRSLADAFRHAAEASSEARRSMRRRARKLYNDRFSFSSGIGQLESILRRVARARGEV